MILATGSTAQALDAVPSTYVALGDSYTAGPQIPDQEGDPTGCGRSSRNYPNLVSQRLGYTELIDMSCSGAGTEELTGPQDVAGGINPAQFDALDTGVDLVTLGIGGNDIGFTQLATDCIALLPLGSPCQDRFVSPEGDTVSIRIAQTAHRIEAALHEIRRRAPQATVVVVGYPSILPEAYAGCWPLMPYAPSDVGYLRNKTVELNSMLEQQAVSNGAVFVDVYAPSLGRDACALPGHRWVEPVVPLAPAAPVHPNATGMQGMAEQIVQRIG